MVQPAEGAVVLRQVNEMLLGPVEASDGGRGMTAKKDATSVADPHPSANALLDLQALLDIARRRSGTPRRGGS